MSTSTSSSSSSSSAAAAAASSSASSTAAVTVTSFPSLATEVSSLGTASIDETYDGSFSKIFGTRDYIDKTDFIRAAFVPGRISLITAPTKFGKTNNLLMLQDFFSYFKASNKNSEHYKNLKISKDEKFFYNNFRRHPVLFIDFSAEGNFIDNRVNSVIRVIKMAISKAFLEQKQYIEKKEIKSSDLKMCNFWCDKPIDEIKIKPEKMFENLRRLVSMMKKAFNKNVIVLIDNYDSVLNKTLQINEFVEEDFRFVLDLTNKLLNTLFAKNSDISSAVVTGVSSLMTKLGINVNNLDFYNFLGPHQFNEYFGITETELDTLLNMEEHKDLLNEKRAIDTLYGGYDTRRRAIYRNPYSVMQCLKTKTMTTHWDVTFYVDILLAFAKSPEGTRIVDRCLRRQFLHLKLQSSPYTNGEIMYFKLLHSDLGLDSSKCNLFIPYFIDLGLLSYTSRSHPRFQDKAGHVVLVKIVNEEVYSQIEPKFKSYLCRKLNIPENNEEIFTYMKFVEKMNKDNHSGWLELFRDYVKLSDFGLSRKHLSSAVLGRHK